MIRDKVAQLSARMHDGPQYPSQGAVLFVDLERREHFSKFLPVAVLRSFLSGRGANMFLLITSCSTAGSLSTRRYR